MIGDTTLSGYNLFRPLQQGQPIDCRIAHRKCYKICKNEPFLPGSFCAMDFPPVLVMWDQWKFQAKQRKRSPYPVNSQNNTTCKFQQIGYKQQGHQVEAFFKAFSVASFFKAFSVASFFKAFSVSQHLLFNLI